MEKVEINDVKLMKLLNQFNDVSLRQSDAGFGLLSKLELFLQLLQFVVHLDHTPVTTSTDESILTYVAARSIQ